MLGAQRRASAVHGARVPRHRLPGAARERRQSSCPRSEHTILLSGEPDVSAIAWDEFVARGSAVTDAELDARVASIGTDDPSDVVFTSGTTGSPKGVVMTHGQTLRAYLDWCDWADLRAGDRYLIANPFFHIFGYKAGCLACLMRGATIFPLAVFDAGVVLEIVERERISVLPGPPTIYQSLLDHPDRARRDISSLRVGVTGAADIPVELIRRVREELPFERILTGYGLTEAGTVTGCNARRRLRAHRHDGRCPVAGLRGAHGDRSRVPTPR